MRKSWCLFDHAADMGIRARGATLDEVFAQIAMGMMNIVTDQPIATEEQLEVRCSAPDLQLLLVDWLNSLIFEMATRRMLFGDFSVQVQADAGQYRLLGQARGERLDVARHQPTVEVKGATYTALDLHQHASGHWYAQCVVDV